MPATAANVGYEAELWQMADAQRDTLLPQRISGELRVRDAERFVDGVDSVDEVDGGRA